jgi:hypothetical protein
MRGKIGKASNPGQLEKVGGEEQLLFSPQGLDILFSLRIHIGFDKQSQKESNN